MQVKSRFNDILDIVELEPRKYEVIGFLIGNHIAGIAVINDGKPLHWLMHPQTGCTVLNMAQYNELCHILSDVCLEWEASFHEE